MKGVFVTFAVLLGGLHAEFLPLCNGKDLSGWKVQDAAYWKVENGAIVGASDQAMKNSVLWTEAHFGDFVLEGQFRFSGDIDSGIFLRNSNEQIQIGTSRSLKRDMTGSPYIGSKGKYPVEAKGVRELFRDGEWTAIRIEARGNVYQVSVAGKEVLHYESDTAIDAKPGPIGLQIHQGVQMKIEFKDLKVEKR